MTLHTDGLPDEISVDTHGPRVVRRITLDGHDVKLAFAANRAEGWVDVWDEAATKAKGADEDVTKRLTGRVEFFPR